jgi:secreted Zn-dependent insulinase-like peptidase
VDLNARLGPLWPQHSSACHGAQVHALESELRGAAADDDVRLELVQAACAAPGHPAAGFPWGSLETLWNAPSASGAPRCTSHPSTALQ